MFVWIFVDYYENDGDAFMTAPKVYRTKKAAMAAYNARVKKVFDEEINEEYDEIVNRLEKEGYIHLAVNYDTHYTIYVKKVKVIE